MRITDWRGRRLGCAVAVVAAFWLGFLCGGGGSLSGAAAIQAPPGTGQQDQPPADPPPASQAPEEPAPTPEEAPETQAGSETDAEPGPETDAEPGPAPPLVQDRPREFTADIGVMLNFLRPEGDTAFEETMTRVAEALAASESEERRRQADGWSTYRAEEPLADGVILYVSWLDPAVPGADYWVPGILNEAFPTEAQGLYETYAGAFADGQILLNLSPVAGP